MRYFLDTEYDGFGGPLLSLALVPEDGGEEFYVVLSHDVTDPWVQRHVVPYLDTVPETLRSSRQSREGAARALGAWLNHEFELQLMVSHPEVPDMEIVADWPEDIAQFCMLMLKGPGAMVPTPHLRFDLVQFPNFSTAANSAVPHNALHDARALRDHIMGFHL